MSTFGKGAGPRLGLSKATKLQRKGEQQTAQPTLHPHVMDPNQLTPEKARSQPTSILDRSAKEYYFREASPEEESDRRGRSQTRGGSRERDGRSRSPIVRFGHYKKPTLAGPCLACEEHGHWSLRSSSCTSQQALLWAYEREFWYGTDLAWLNAAVRRGWIMPSLAILEEIWEARKADDLKGIEAWSDADREDVLRGHEVTVEQMIEQSVEPARAAFWTDQFEHFRVKYADHPTVLAMSDLGTHKLPLNMHDK